MAGQITIRRLFGLVLLFLFFETIVWILAALLLPDTSPLLVCGVMTGLALAVWVVYALTTRWFMRPHPVATPAPVTRQAPAPPSPPAPGPIDGELEEARRLYDEAAARLAGAPAFAGRQSGEAIRELPLFLVAGAEGSGKTTVLLHCGTEGQLLAGQVQRDAAVIPTRAWNLWYGGGALFADVSGRIFSDEGGRWAGLLQIATNSRRKHLLRRLWEGDLGRRTLRGVILVLNAAEFLHNPDPQKTAATARRCQDRLRAIAQRFGVSFPVYVLFTRADAIPYFGDYFARLSEQEDQRILGCTLSPQREAEGGPQQIEVETKRLNNAFTTVYQSLADKRLTMLARESMTSRRPNVYEFPREFKRIRSEVVRFLVDVFRPSPLERGPVLRGFYFTGVRQVASATQLDEIPVGATVVRGGIDATGLFRPGDFSRSIARQSHTRAETPSPVLPRWAFLAELFRKVIVADQPMASQMVVMDPRLQRLRRYGLIAVTALSALASFCFAASWMNNRRLLEDVRSAAITSASPTGGSSLLQALEAMEPLRAKLALLRQYDRDGAPLRLRWGLYSGERVEQDLRRAYFERFREVFLTPTLTAIDQKLSQLDSPSDGPAYSQAYNYLKSYRMMTSGRCKPETNPLAQVFSEAWRGGRSLDTRTEELAGLQMSFYVSELQRANPYSISEDAAAVERGQRYLSGFGGAARIYRSILEDVNRSGTPPARLASLAPNYEDVLSGPGEVPASFTRGAWNQVLDQIRKRKSSPRGEACVLGESPAEQWIGGRGAEAELEQNYVQDYIKTWNDFLAAEKILPYRNAADGARKLGILADSRSPLLALLFLVGENTAFPAQNQSAPSPLREKAASALDRLLPSARRSAEKVEQAAKPPSNLAQSDIPRAFQPVHAAVNPTNRDRWINDANKAYVSSLGELRDSLQNIAQAPRNSVDTSVYEQGRRSVERAWANVRALEQSFNNTPEGVDLNVKTVLEAPIEYAGKLIPHDAAQPLISQMNAAARNMCRQFDSMRRKYPFNPSAENEVSLEELTHFFAPANGVLTAFTQQPPAANLLVHQGKTWTQNPSVAQARLNPRFLTSLNQMTAVADALFPEGAGQPRLQYTLTPSYSDNVQSLTLQIDGHSANYSGHKRAKEAEFVWPGPAGAQGARLMVKSGTTLQYSYTGLWGVFRMLDSADSKPGPNQFDFLRLSRQGRSIPEPALGSNGEPMTVHLEAESQGANVFQRGLFSNIACVATAAQ